jgi:hypothetical protein
VLDFRVAEEKLMELEVAEGAKKTHWRVVATGEAEAEAEELGQPVTATALKIHHGLWRATVLVVVQGEVEEERYLEYL